MKKVKNWLIAVFMLLPMMVSAYDFEADGIYYNIISEDDLVVEVTKSTIEGAYSGDVIIPKQITKYGQTYIVKRIGVSAFSDSKKLNSIFIPETIDSISFPFASRCPNFTEVKVDGNNPYFSSVNGILFDKTRKTLRLYPSGKRSVTYTIPDGVVRIGRYAFGNDYLTALYMPSSITHIEEYAISCANLSRIELSTSLEYLGSSAISNCPISDISLPESLKYIGSYCFDNCIKLQFLVIPKNVDYIGTGVGYALDSLQAINVSPENLNYTSIDGILYNKELTRLIQCPAAIKNMEWITLPSTITHINEGAFILNKSLNRIVIPSSIIEIGDGAFNYCTNLRRVTCYAKTPPTIPGGDYKMQNPFNYIDIKSVTLYVPKGCANAYKKVYYNNRYGTIYPWKQFGSIIEIDEESGIDDIIKENGILTIYTIEGKQIFNGKVQNASEATQDLPSGVYVVNGKKVVVK